MKTTDIQCDSCERMLKENELPENRNKHRIPTPWMPEPKDRECFICYVGRADLDGPNNNSVSTHKKDEDSFHKTLANFKRQRDN
mgnify:CR=1 FL=1